MFKPRRLAWAATQAVAPLIVFVTVAMFLKLGIEFMPPTNTVCPVMGKKVNPAKSPKVAVRGQEYYICCKGCEKKLAEHPDKYLEQDGTPKNAKAKK